MLSSDVEPSWNDLREFESKTLERSELRSPAGPIGTPSPRRWPRPRCSRGRSVRRAPPWLERPPEEEGATSSVLLFLVVMHLLLIASIAPSRREERYKRPKGGVDSVGERSTRFELGA